MTRSDLLHTLYDLELVAQSISVNSDPEDLRTAKDLLQVAHARLQQSIQHLTV